MKTNYTGETLTLSRAVRVWGRDSSVLAALGTSLDASEVADVWEDAVERERAAALDALLAHGCPGSLVPSLQLAAASAHSPSSSSNSALVESGGGPMSPPPLALADGALLALSSAVSMAGGGAAALAHAVISAADKHNLWCVCRLLRVALRDQMCSDALRRAGARNELTALRIADTSSSGGGEGGGGGGASARARAPLLRAAVSDYKSLGASVARGCQFFYFYGHAAPSAGCDELTLLSWKQVVDVLLLHEHHQVFLLLLP
ncbi:hypothetical protein T492DRAFT_835364 [Pavlovales sp. CCMP2436]|nr:hypothetical protein T492DRAFT_835364 [Pavlovales sp. CCMP2436]